MQPLKGRRGRVFPGLKEEKKKGESSHGAFSEMEGRGGEECIPKVEQHVMTVSEEKL